MCASWLIIRVAGGTDFLRISGEEDLSVERPMFSSCGAPGFVVWGGGDDRKYTGGGGEIDEGRIKSSLTGLAIASRLLSGRSAHQIGSHGF